MIGQIIKMDRKVYIFHQTIFRLSHLDRREIENRLYACINKPIDPDELFFWIDSIRKEGKNT